MSCPTAQAPPATLNTDMIDTIHCAGVALERLEGVYKQAEAQRAQVSQTMPKIASALIRAGLIDEPERRDLERTLADHISTLELLGSLARSVSTDQDKQASANHLGTPVPGGNAYGQPGPAYAGVSGSRMAPSEREYYRQLGVSVPEDV